MTELLRQRCYVMKRGEQSRLQLVFIMRRVQGKDFRTKIATSVSIWDRRHIRLALKQQPVRVDESAGLRTHDRTDRR